MTYSISRWRGVGWEGLFVLGFYSLYFYYYYKSRQHLGGLVGLALHEAVKGEHLISVGLQLYFDLGARLVYSIFNKI
jgi:hypothetical protein